jgi:HEAT repeat protein
MSRNLLILCVLMFPILGIAQQAPSPTTTPAQAAPPPQVPKPATPPQNPPDTPAQTSNGAPAPVEKAEPRAKLLADAWAVLQLGATSDKSRDRSDALVAISVLDRDSKAIATMEAALDDKDVDIRILAVSSLGDMKARHAIPLLRKTLDDDSAQISFAAAQALWKMDDHSGRDIIYEVLNGDRKVSPGLIKSKLDKAKLEMHDPKALVLIGVNEASGAFLGPFSMGVSFLEEYAKHNPAPLQSLCAQLLVSDRSPEAVDELSAALGDKNWSVRAAAARALAKMNHREVIPQRCRRRKSQRIPRQALSRGCHTRYAAPVAAPQ